ncbi:substrate-binding domain-containing protein [Herbiconiux sp. KACC 21604]|uniref:substrate-binding domain-containing protein n=1 Tax=unclassified Herbiconiux TaxID=2618217 RepID=UPI001490DBB3|nr:substrate-binding domain-containing protein [Herbiconiux sp. SALV-R1]QJU55285.1 substrate-binding domain-containing protein [Herbiconiux sp. SALV-R1]WPO86452.1 substrate-binding domain-containing protein [Herbiconiux sp. KACC 21604]
MKRTLPAAVALAAVSVLALTGCTSENGEAESGKGPTFAEDAFSTAESSGNSEDWVSWDAASCAFQPAEDHPDEWAAAARKPTGDFTVGFAAQDTVNEVNVTMNESMTSFAEDAGVSLAFADYKFPSTSEPVAAARSIVVREPSVVVSNNQVDDLLASVNQVYQEACLPVVQVVTEYDGTVLFGPSNSDMGRLEGERLVEFAEAQGWTAEDSTLITTLYPVGGPEVAKRAGTCKSVVEEAFPGIPSISHDTNSTNALELQNNFSDVLTSNPDAGHILVCTNADLWALADANALELAGRQADAAVVGVNGGSAVLDAIEAGNTALIGTVDLGAAQWGEYWIPLAEDIAAGKPVPAQVYAPITMLPAELPAR